MSSLAYFDKVATQWDELRTQFFSDNVREKAMDAARVEPGKLAADIGAGSGFITQGLLARGVRVIAVDQSQEMLDVTSAKFAAAKVGDARNVEYRLGDADALPIADETCDYVFANMYLHHTEIPSHAILEMARILKRGGALVITDADEHNFEFLRAEHHDRWLGFKRAEIQKWFAEAGLGEIEVRDAEEKCSSTAANGNDQANVNIFLARGTK